MGRPKIALFMSVFLSRDTLKGENYYGGHTSPTSDKLEQLISCLHSISNFDFFSANIFLDSDEYYKSRLLKSIHHLESLLPTANFYPYRLQYFDQWKSAANLVRQSDVVLLKTNHDHVYIRENRTDFYRYIESMLNLSKEFVGSITHWPEHVFQHKSGRWVKEAQISLPVFRSICTTTNGTCLVTPQLFNSWWDEDFTLGHRIVRPDNPFGPRIHFDSVDYFVPPVEFFRHLDGYGHKKVNSPVSAPLRGCCRENNGIVEHKDYIYGRFFLNKLRPELPHVPTFEQNWTIASIVDFLLLASSYRPSLQNLTNLTKIVSQGVRPIKFWFLMLTTLLLLSTERHFLEKSFLRLLPIEDGNRILYRFRVKTSIFIRRAFFGNHTKFGFNK